MEMINTLDRCNEISKKDFFLKSIAQTEIADFSVRGSYCISLHKEDYFGSEVNTIYLTKVGVNNGYWTYSKPTPIYYFFHYPLLKEQVPQRLLKRVDEQLMDAIYYKNIIQDEEFERIEALYPEFFDRIEFE